MLMYQLHIRRFVYPHMFLTMAEARDNEVKFFAWCAVFRGFTMLLQMPRIGQGAYELDKPEPQYEGYQKKVVNGGPIKMYLDYFYQNMLQLVVIFEQMSCPRIRSESGFPVMVQFINELFQLAGLELLNLSLTESGAVDLGRVWWDEIRGGTCNYADMLSSMLQSRDMYFDKEDKEVIPAYDPTQTHEHFAKPGVSKGYTDQFPGSREEVQLSVASTGSRKRPRVGQ